MTRARRTIVMGGLLTAVGTLVHGHSLPQLKMLRQGLPRQEDARRAARLSADGRFVAFVSVTALVPADANTVTDIYVFDRQQAVLTLETPAWDGGASNGGSGNPALSADGDIVVFDSDATNLTAGSDDNLARDVFVRHRRTGSTRRISAGRSGQDANQTSFGPTVSADGRVAVFVSSATNLVEGVDANGRIADVYLARLDTGEIARVSVGSDGRQWPASQSVAPALSADGHLVAFTSTAATASATARSSEAGGSTVWMRDVTSGVTTCLSCGRSGAAFDADITSDGRYAVFTWANGRLSDARRTDIVLLDRTTRVTRVVTRDANGSSARPDLSATGRFVVFQSQASNLECQRQCELDVSDKNLMSDIYQFDRETGLFCRLSGDPGSWWAPSIEPSVDQSGRVVVFSSRQPLSADELTTDFDLFIWSRDGEVARRP